MPSITFENDYILRVGNRIVELSYKGVNHSAGNTFVYLPQAKVVMLVDLVYPGWVPFKYLALTKHVKGFIEAHDQLLSYDFEHYVGGHLSRTGMRQDVMIAREYVHDLRASAANALKTTNFMNIVKEVGFGNSWALFDAYLDAVAENCNQEMIPKWTKRLGGADVFGFSHCWTMMESLRID